MCLYAEKHPGNVATRRGFSGKNAKKIFTNVMIQISYLGNRYGNCDVI